MKKYIISFAIALVLSTGIVYAVNTFPTTLNSWSSGQTISSAWANALEAKIGANSSAVRSSLDFKVNTLIATTSIPTLSITKSQVSNFDTSVNSYVHASTTIPKTYTTNTFSALQTFTLSPKSSATCSATGELCDYDYINTQVSAGVPSSTPLLSGKAKLSVTALNVNDPIVVGNNDPRMGSVGVWKVSTTTDSFGSYPNNTTFATSTLTNIPFGTSTKIQIFASSTAGEQIAIRFNSDATAGNYNCSISRSGDGSSDCASVNGGLLIEGGIDGLLINLDFWNSTSSNKTGTITATRLDYFYTGGFTWKNKTSPITSVSFGKAVAASLVGSTTINAYVIK